MAQRGKSTSGNSSNKGSGLSQLAGTARSELQELLGRPVDAVLGMEKNDEDGGWTVTLEVVEVDRIPETTSIMGVYAVTMDGDGSVTGYRRTRRYHRGQPSEDG
jgi:hypothetical protein